jgi:hypothetical protein
MNKDFNTMVTNVGTRVQDTTTPFATILKPLINKRYFQVLRVINWQNIRYDYTFDTVAGTQDYVLPDDFGKEISVRDTTNGLELGSYDYQKLVTDYPDEVEDSGSVARYIITEEVVKEQPTSTSVVSMVSSSSADTTQSILIRGITGGIETTELVLLTGTSTNPLAHSTNSYTRIKGISKSAITTGSVTLTTNSATVQLAVLPPKVTESRYKIMKLHYVPTTTIEISVPYIIKPLPLVENNDYPTLDIADLIEMGAEADAWRYKRQGTKASACESLYEVELQRYIFDKENQPNVVNQFIPVTFDKDNLY